MRFRETQNNPLPEILDLIPETGREIDDMLLTAVGLILNKYGGIVCETFKEVLCCLELLACEEYNILGITPDGKKIYRIKHGN